MLSGHLEKTYTPKVLYLIRQDYYPSNDRVWLHLATTSIRSKVQGSNGETVSGD